MKITACYFSMWKSSLRLFWFPIQSLCYNLWAFSYSVFHWIENEFICVTSSVRGQAEHTRQELWRTAFWLGHNDVQLINEFSWGLKCAIVTPNICSCSSRIPSSEANIRRRPEIWATFFSNNGSDPMLANSAGIPRGPPMLANKY